MSFSNTKILDASMRPRCQDEEDSLESCFLFFHFLLQLCCVEMKGWERGMGLNFTDHNYFIVVIVLASQNSSATLTCFLQYVSYASKAAISVKFYKPVDLGFS